MADFTGIGKLPEELEEQSSVSETDLALVGGSDTKKTTWQNIFEKINFSNLITTAKNIIEALNELKDAYDTLKSDQEEMTTNTEPTIIAASQTNYTAGTFKAVCRNGILDLHLIIAVSTAAGSWVTIGTLPEAYRPYAAIYKDVPHFNAALGNAHLRLRITAAGEVQIAGGTNGASYAFHDVFVVA